MPRTDTVAPKPSRFTMLASVCVIVAALYFAQDVLMPVALAVLLSFLLTPIVRRLERWRLGRAPSVLVAVTLLFGLIGVLGYVVGQQLFDLANNLDLYKGNITAKVDALRPSRGGILEKVEHVAAEVQDRLQKPEAAATTQSTQPSDVVANVAADELQARTRDPRTVTERSKGTVGTNPTTVPWTKENPMPVAMVQPRPGPFERLGAYLGFVLGPLGTLGIVIVFVIFMLLQREDLRNRLIRLAGKGQLTIATQALDDATGRISRYLLAQAIVNGTYGAAVSIALWLIGLTLGQRDPSGTDAFPNVILWGLLCALLRFIPYIGPWIAAAFPLLISLAVYKGFGVFLATGAMFVVIELISNNFMEPMLYGSSTGMSTVAVLVSAVFWTWLWGPVGLLLATPLTVVLVVLGKYIPQLAFLDVLLGDEPVLPPSAQLYQRMLALDAEEAVDLAREYHAQVGSLEGLYDTMLIPALAMAEQDRHRGQLDDRRQVFIRHTMRDILDELGDEERARLLREAAAETEARARRGDAAVDEEEPAAPKAAGGSVSVSPSEADNGSAAAPPARRPRVPADCDVTVACLPAHDEADEICNLMLAQLLEFQGYHAFSASQNALASELMDEVEQKRADVVVGSALPPSAVAHARYLCKRLHARFPELPMLVGVWTVRADRQKVRDRITCVADVEIATTLGELLDELHQAVQPLLVRCAPNAPAAPAAPTAPATPATRGGR